MHWTSFYKLHVQLMSYSSGIFLIANNAQHKQWLKTYNDNQNVWWKWWIKEERKVGFEEAGRGQNWLYHFFITHSTATQKKIAVKFPRIKLHPNEISAYNLLQTTMIIIKNWSRLFFIILKLKAVKNFTAIFFSYQFLSGKGIITKTNIFVIHIIHIWYNFSMNMSI